jgi:glycosyltransferase involved in cell wall biosynthesis
VDTWVLGTHARHHGVQVYITKLLEHFPRLASNHSVEILPYRCSGGSDTDLDASPIYRATRLLAHDRLWKFGGGALRSRLDGADLVFNPHCSGLYPTFLTPVVTTIHDVIPEVLPWSSPSVRTLRFLLRAAARSSRAIITVSQHSKADIVRTYGTPEERVHVVYNGCDHTVFNARPADKSLLQSVKNRFGIQRPYIFHCGAIKPNKNLKHLIAAYRCLLSRFPDRELDLVLAGPSDTGSEDLVSAAKPVNECGRVILTGPLAASELVLLMKGASLAVFPSLYEGFCMPMVECMACGVPTIASSASCMPEISGNVLRYFNPESVEQMAACMEALLFSDELRRQLSYEGQQRALIFDWGRCASETLTVLAGAIGTHGSNEKHSGIASERTTARTA